MSDLQDRVAARHERIDKGLQLLEKQSMQLGAKAEQQRIIKLVERFGFDEELGFSFEQAKEDLLTLIKGEK